MSEIVVSMFKHVSKEFDTVQVFLYLQPFLIFTAEHCTREFGFRGFHSGVTRVPLELQIQAESLNSPYLHVCCLQLSSDPPRDAPECSFLSNAAHEDETEL